MISALDPDPESDLQHFGDSGSGSRFCKKWNHNTPIMPTIRLQEYNSVVKQQNGNGGGGKQASRNGGSRVSNSSSNSQQQQLTRTANNAAAAAAGGSNGSNYPPQLR